MDKITEFTKKHRIYSTGYVVSTVTYFSYHGPQMEGIAELTINFVAAGLVGFTSWAYVAARVINAFCI